MNDKYSDHPFFAFHRKCIEYTFIAATSQKTSESLHPIIANIISITEILSVP